MRCRFRLVALALASFVWMGEGLHGQGIAIGAKGGVNFADVSSDEFGLGGAGGRTGLVGGGFFQATGSGGLGFQTELLYSQKGLSALVTGGTAVAELDYVEIPLLLRYRLVDQSQKVRPSLLGGWFVAFEASCGLSGAGVEGSTDCENLLGARGNVDGGFVFGASVDIGFRGRYFFVLDGRYNLGVMNLDWEEADDRVSSRAWSFTGGVGVLLGF